MTGDKSPVDYGVKILIIGHKRHGKDTAAELLQAQIGLNFHSSSERANEIFIFDALKEKYNYSTLQESFDDRVNHRAEWHDLICEYNKEDRARLAKDIVSDTDCYVGMRCPLEIAECKRIGLFKFIIWIDATNRLELESEDSFRIGRRHADFCIDNNGTLDEFKDHMRVVGNFLRKEFMYHAMKED